ncbi:nagb/rpia/CoA transferase-like protein [Jaminaea rosea]|uniref:Translation initiation factor eIF2B subunit delta n=1 Tax=Jaminaea rosea TaxID=1569628 RepID=A0A316UNA8_9BASI|nr:nagb/rpia/CoA transferase-like protein [Jaminaea rosea]PWN25831.1 nagb/rpia/CoA transferase-like protein [Jaminaea rosea]
MSAPKDAAASASSSSSAPKDGAAPSASLSSKDAKAAAKAAKAAKRAAAKGLAVGERQHPPKNEAGTTAGQQAAAAGGQATHQGRGPKESSSAAGAASASSSAPASSGAAAATPSQTLASLASTNASLLQPTQTAAAGPSSSTGTLSSHDLITTVHPPSTSHSTRSTLLTTSLTRSLHPSILQLQQHLASHTLLGSSARAIATLAALRDFIADYKTPRGAVLNRDLVGKLGAQIGGITAARPLGTSAGNAVRYLKYEIGVVPADMGEDEAKNHLISRIDHFVRDRIVLASRVISSHISSKLRSHGDVVVTFARSSVVERCLLDAWQVEGKRFEVICVSGETFDEGPRMAEALLSKGIPTSCVPLTALGSVMPRASLVLLGTASLLADGALYSRAGTATVAMVANRRKVPVIVCCETYKFSERVRLEGVGGNERADGHDDDLEDGSSTPSNLTKLNLVYDLTPAKYITAVASEVGLSGPESVAILLRDYKSILFGS